MKAVACVLRRMFLLWLLPLWVLSLSCAPILVPGTKISDTPVNRQILAVVSELREAMELRDANRLIPLISRSYFEDCGTADASDDYGYIELIEQLLPDSFRFTKEVVLTFQLHDLIVKQREAYVDIRYITRTRMDFPAGRLWDNHRDFDRLELVLEKDGQWRFISGL